MISQICHLFHRGQQSAGGSGGLRRAPPLPPAPEVFA